MKYDIKDKNMSDILVLLFTATDLDPDFYQYDKEADTHFCDVELKANGKDVDFERFCSLLVHSIYARNNSDLIEKKAEERIGKLLPILWDLARVVQDSSCEIHDIVYGNEGDGDDD